MTTPDPEWRAQILPNSELGDCLVGQMLANDRDVPPVLPEDGSSLPVLSEDVLTGEAPPP
jgi:hypothetical protein